MKPDLEAARRKYQQRAATYDSDVKRAEVTRIRAVELLELKPGDVVLDVGCGTGLSFPLVEERIGPSGRLLGIEASPEMLALARDRVRVNGWDNVTLLEGSADEAVVPFPPDALLFHFVHDIMRSRRAIENVFDQAKPGARVAAAGAKWSNWWAVPVNAYVWYISRKYVTTLEGFNRPWSTLRDFVPDLSVEPMIFGAVYVAWGRGRLMPPLAEGEEAPTD